MTLAREAAEAAMSARPVDGRHSMAFPCPVPISIVTIAVLGLHQRARANRTESA
jgi:hypothetical protein